MPGSDSSNNSNASSNSLNNFSWQKCLTTAALTAETAPASVYLFDVGAHAIFFQPNLSPARQFSPVSPTTGFMYAAWRAAVKGYPLYAINAFSPSATKASLNDIRSYSKEIPTLAAISAADTLFTSYPSNKETIRRHNSLLAETKSKPEELLALPKTLGQKYDLASAGLCTRFVRNFVSFGGLLVTDHLLEQYPNIPGILTAMPAALVTTPLSMFFDAALRSDIVSQQKLPNQRFVYQGTLKTAQTIFKQFGCVYSVPQCLLVAGRTLTLNYVLIQSARGAKSLHPRVQACVSYAGHPSTFFPSTVDSSNANAEQSDHSSTLTFKSLCPSSSF